MVSRSHIIVNSSNWIAGGAIISWLKGQVGHLTSSVASNSSLVQVGGVFISISQLLRFVISWSEQLEP